MRFENKRGPKIKREKMCFVGWKVYFSSCYYFIILFPFISKMISKA